MSGFDRSQLRKGTLEGCILQIIARAPNYGYAIADALRASGFQDVNEEFPKVKDTIPKSTLTLLPEHAVVRLLGIECQFLVTS